MDKKEKAEFIKIQLDRLYPETETFLHYKKEYELLFAVILSAQATDKSANEATSLLFEKFPSLDDYSYENQEQILACISKVGLGKVKTSYLIKSASLLKEKYHGILPKDRKELMKFPGVGFKTSGVVLAELYDFPYIPVDTHVYRVTHRLGIVKEELGFEDTELALEKMFKEEHKIALHRQFILLGRNICKSLHPKCEECPLSELCKYKKQNMGRS